MWVFFTNKKKEKKQSNEKDQKQIGQKHCSTEGKQNQLPKQSCNRIGIEIKMHQTKRQHQSFFFYNIFCFVKQQRKGQYAVTEISQ